MPSSNSSDPAAEQRKLRERFVAEIKDSLEKSLPELRRQVDNRLKRSFARLENGNLIQVGQAGIPILPPSQVTSTERGIR
jgi:hypothetical protein